MKLNAVKCGKCGKVHSTEKGCPVTQVTDWEQKQYKFICWYICGKPEWNSCQRQNINCKIALTIMEYIKKEIKESVITAMEGYGYETLKIKGIDLADE